MNTTSISKTSRSIIRNTFYIQLTAFILLSLSSSVGSMIDGVVIGQFLGVDSIAAFGIINPLMIAFSIIGAVSPQAPATGLQGCSAPAKQSRPGRSSLWPALFPQDLPQRSCFSSLSSPDRSQAPWALPGTTWNSFPWPEGT